MGRAPCCEKNGLKKGPWTPEEDQKLIDYIQKNGCGNWRTLPKNAGLQRCGKSCRLRWTNYLRPDIKRGRFSFAEEEAIIQLHGILGNKWSAIAARLPGRTDNEIKNYWNTHIRKRLLRMGIDPVTHTPRLDFLDLSSILSSSLYNNPSQMINLSRFLGGLQPPLVIPELLRLATSLLTSRRENQNQNPNLLLQNDRENQLCIPPQVQNQLLQTNPPIDQEIPTRVPPFPYNEEAQLVEPNVDHFSPNFTHFNSQSSQVNEFEWESNGMGMAAPASNSNLGEDHYVALPNYDNYYGSDQSIMANPSENSNFQSNNSNYFGFASVLSNLSTPSSSPAPLNSNSTYINSGSTTTEDERESYCSGNLMIKFEIPHMLDVNEFM